jgi:hypothetical protein
VGRSSLKSWTLDLGIKYLTHVRTYSKSALLHACSGTGGVYDLLAAFFRPRLTPQLPLSPNASAQSRQAQLPLLTSAFKRQVVAAITQIKVG